MVISEAHQRSWLQLVSRLLSCIVHSTHIQTTFRIHPVSSLGLWIGTCGSLGSLLLMAVLTIVWFGSMSKNFTICVMPRHPSTMRFLSLPSSSMEISTHKISCAVVGVLLRSSTSTTLWRQDQSLLILRTLAIDLSVKPCVMLR